MNRTLANRKASYIQAVESSCFPPSMGPRYPQNQDELADPLQPYNPPAMRKGNKVKTTIA
jgi:hypothetical protein